MNHYRYNKFTTNLLFVFGSMTCPMTASSAPSVQELHEEFGDRVDFIMLYVREAHPGENYAQAESMDDKIESARALHLALKDAADGKALRRTQSTRLFGPVVRAMGSVRETMRRGGPQAERDLWRAAFPMALAGLVASWFGPLSPGQRGIAAVLTMTIGMIVMLGLLSAVVLS